MLFEFLMLSAVFMLCGIWLLVALAIYFLPVIIGYVRKHNNILAILVLNVILGWTFFGWLAALLWALNCDVNPDKKAKKLSVIDSIKKEAEDAETIPVEDNQQDTGGV